MKYRPSLASLIVALLLNLILLSTNAWASKPTYRYQESDGTIWFMDRKPVGEQAQRFRFLGYYGRQTATASCRGLTKTSMENRGQQYHGMIDTLAAKYRVSRWLVRAIVAVESCFDRLAVSRAGAKGLMQLMPATARQLKVNDVYDPFENLRGGIEYFSQLQRQFNYDDRLALAAYNAGPKAVEKYQGIPPYNETQGYVKRVLERYRNYLHNN